MEKQTPNICVDDEDDPGEGSSQQVDHKVVVDDLNNANVNKSKVREDDLDDVLKIIKVLEGDQITEWRGKHPTQEKERRARKKRKER
jgi:hypothetical protein